MKQSGWRRFLAGILIGIGCILPGISGGVMAVSFGLYRPMLDAALDFFKAPRKHLRFLAPLSAGIFIGIALGAAGLSAAMARYESLMLMLFTGFILGGVPDLMKEAQSGGRFRKKWLWALGLGVGLALPMCLIRGEGAVVNGLSAVQAFITGVLEGLGTVIPGVSTSFLLIRLGWYQAFLRSISGLTLHTLLFVGLGFLISTGVCMRAVKWLFDHHSGYAFYGVLGFLLVSVALVFPGFTSLFWAEISTLLIGAVSARWVSAYES